MFFFSLLLFWYWPQYTRNNNHDADAADAAEVDDDDADDFVSHIHDMAWHIGTASMATNEHIRVERIGIGQCRLGFSSKN